MLTLDTLLTIRDLILVVVGFGAIVFLHELGHFLAAKWAGVRVLAFAIGFGPAVASYRKGLGLRKGSTEAEYRRLLASNKAGDVSPTEYRFNGLPFGGYVKMLGQDDADPSYRSDEPDSYQNCTVPKRMVIISAGVIVNLITAAIIFLIVFTVGLRMEPAWVGAVGPGTPAAMTEATNARQAGLAQPGLKPGDRVLKVNGREPQAFTDLITAAGLASRGHTVTLEVAREGVSDTLRFDIRPEPGETTGLMELGIAPAVSLTLESSGRPGLNAAIGERIEASGLEGVAPGSRLVEARVGGVARELSLANELSDLYDTSGGETVTLVFEAPSGDRVTVDTRPIPELEVARAPLPSGDLIAFEHLLGLTPVITVNEAPEDSAGYDQGLRSGDIFVQVAQTEFPSVPEGIGAVRKASRGTVELSVRRSNGQGVEEVRLEAEVDSQGRIGFFPGSSERSSALLTTLPRGTETLVGRELSEDNPAAALALPRGSVVTGVERVAGEPIAVGTLLELRDALQRVTRPAFETGDESATVTLLVRMPTASGSGPVMEREWTLDRVAFERLHGLTYSAPFPLALFKLEEKVVKADGPIDAFAMGIGRTHNLMMSTYLTLARLFEGTVRVEHLKGPVGIAHAGTIVAQRGLLWLLFFGAVVSVNLAVINFLPIPIVDGGQFLLLIAEWARGKPVPIVFQNVITLAGLALIGTVFLIVTFNDITNLLG